MEFDLVVMMNIRLGNKHGVGQYTISILNTSIMTYLSIYLDVTECNCVRWEKWTSQLN